MRLIDAKAGKKVFNAIARPAEYKGVIHMVVPISEIDKLPTVDAVPVVRCKDCKHSEKNGGDCNSTLAITSRDYVLEQNVTKYITLEHCSYGERRNDV